MEPEKIRKLAEAMAQYAASAFGWSLDSHGSTAREIEQTLAAVWPKVFPPEQPPEGSVRVRIAAVYGPEAAEADMETEGWPAASLFTATLSETSITHRGIIGAWLPPVPQVPTVDGIARSVPDAG